MLHLLAVGYYIAGIYREKASGARVDRPELRRMIADLQDGEVVIAEKIDRVSRLPLLEAERLVATIRAKGARLAIPGVIDLSEVGGEGPRVRKCTLEYCARYSGSILSRITVGLSYGLVSSFTLCAIPVRPPIYHVQYGVSKTLTCRESYWAQ